ncbi:MAG TPA: hypothetical protein VLX56_03135 [Nitrososphaerales archaeon]|nr:hypothetical protein [Nitrososphaerales archaeon]
MGWLGKVVAVAVGLMLFGAGVWQVGLLIFAILLVPPVLRAFTRKGRSKEEDGPRGNSRPRGRLRARDAVGGILLLLAAVAVASHGTLSPAVFGLLGFLVLAWGRVGIRFPGSGVVTVVDSVLLRSSPLPFAWAAVAEVKPLTRDLPKAMAGVRGTVVISASESPSMYVLVERSAVTEKSAEAAILEALRDASLSLAALGAYLLPLDSRQAVALFQPTLQAARLGEGDWSAALASGTYDLISMRQEGGFARSLALYRKTAQGREGKGRMPPPQREFAHPPFLMEVFKAVGNRLTWPGPDQYTAFLSSLVATGGEPIGTRILDAGTSQQAQMVMVRSQASPAVELSRAQLRAVVKIYDKGTR